jgi:hypothetical protein
VVPTEEPEGIVEEPTAAHGGCNGEGDENDELDAIQRVQMNMQSVHLLP